MGEKRMFFDMKNLTILKDAATYTMWAWQTKILFQAHDLLRYVDGEVTIADVPADQVDLWKNNDAAAKSYFLVSTDQCVKQHLLSCTTSKEMMDKLRTVYELDSDHQKNFLMQEMYSYKWQSSKSVLENVSCIKQLAFQLTSLGQTVNDTAIISKVTSILPKDFDAFTTAWDSVPQENKTLDNLCARLQIESGKRENSVKKQRKVTKLSLKYRKNRD